VDSVIVTVAPTFVGDDGVGYGIGLSGDQVQAPFYFKWKQNLETDDISFDPLDSQTATYSDGSDRQRYGCRS
jgi:hypothetical protein